MLLSRLTHIASLCCGVPDQPRSFDHGPIHFVVLDSNVGSTSYTDMIDWMQRDLNALRSRHVGTTGWLIALVHHAPYSKGSEDCDTHKDQRQDSALIFTCRAVYTASMTFAEARGWTLRSS